jgi:SAM-dependent methyltransferase
MTDHALSFGTAASAYNQFRPSYPPEAVTWALGSPTGPVRVVDLGAGTGILTRVLLGLGHDVVPVEPDEAMRAQLAGATPGTVALAGSSEAIPLPADSVDAVVAGQAYHWFDPTRAPAEIARVLRPGGVFAAIWNLRDESVPWVARLTEVAHLEDTHERLEQGVHEEALRAAGFGPVIREDFRHATTHMPDSLIELMKTRSYYLTAPPEGRAEIVAGLRHLTATHPDLAGRDTFELPYRTYVFRASLPLSRRPR